MRDEVLVRASRDLLSIPGLIFRLIRRKLILTALAESQVDLKPLHIEIMKVLQDEGTPHPAKIGDKLFIAKAQMTHLVDHLVEMGLVRREIDPGDRRTLNLSLTAKGCRMLEEQDALVMNALRENMAALSEDELKTLSDSLRNLRDILSKLQ